MAREGVVEARAYNQVETMEATVDLPEGGGAIDSP